MTKERIEKELQKTYAQLEELKAKERSLRSRKTWLRKPKK